MKDKPQDGKMNRRTFLIGTASAGAIAATGLWLGCGGEDGEDGRDGRNGQDAVCGDQVTWDEQTEVIVVGGGGAGLAAAIAAAGVGAAVLLLEKAANVGGSTALCGGVVQGSDTTFQADFGITGDTPQKHFDYWRLAGEGMVDEDLVRLLAEQSGPAVEWLGSLGSTFNEIYAVDPIPTVDPALLVPRLHVADGMGTGLIGMLEQKAQQLGAEIRTLTSVAALFFEEDAGITGVMTEEDGQPRYIQATKGVILASGGFDRNEELARAFSPQLAWDLENGLGLTPPTNVGDGLKMGLAVGAGVAGMGAVISYPKLRIGRAEGDQPIPGLWVNLAGQRFVNEAAHYGYAARAIFDQPEHIVWAVFDETVKNMGGAAIGGWSNDLSEEIASGEIITAASATELAAALGVDPAALEATLARWNADMADSGADTLFDKQTALQALATPPYYAARVLCYNVGSCGGLKIDTEARVIGLDDLPIGGLYAAGMVSGGFIGPYYPGSGTAVCACLVFGRIAGANAAADDTKKRAYAPADRYSKAINCS